MIYKKETLFLTSGLAALGENALQLCSLDASWSRATAVTNSMAHKYVARIITPWIHIPVATEQVAS